ncbi:MAG: acyl-ACP--UDP-N-acetylglucosamine O-acyltransferase [Candidatus Binatia bacterium]
MSKERVIVPFSVFRFMFYVVLMSIHPTAIIDPRAEIHSEADIGPYVVIDGVVQVGRGTRVLAHAVLTGWTEIGEDNVIHMGAVIGHEPQDLAYKGAKTFLKIGNRNTFREHSQIHRGTVEGSATMIGDDNYFMHHSHAAHNCQIGNHTIIAGGALLAGYAQVADRAFVSGNCVVHQFVRIGMLALLRGLSRTSRDVPPFCIMDGTHTVRSINLVGLRRNGFSRERIRALRNAFTRLFRKRVNLKQAVAELRAETDSTDVHYLLDFIEQSKRGVCFGPKKNQQEDLGEE